MTDLAQVLADLREEAAVLRRNGAAFSVERKSVLARLMFASLAWRFADPYDDRAKTRRDLAQHTRELLGGEIHVDRYLAGLRADPAQVYFILLDIPRKKICPVKIGVSENMERRLAALQSAAPYPLRVLTSIPSALMVEHIAHRAFRRQHLRGEWFRYGRRIQRLVADIEHFHATQRAILERKSA